MTRKILLAGLAVLVAAPLHGAVGVNVDGDDIILELEGQVRVRAAGYYDAGPDDGVANSTSTVSQRARLGVRADVGTVAKVHVQIQDVRTWGEETNTNKDYAADNFDLHQGYADLLGPMGFVLRAGRQEILIENQRLVGPVGWSDQARSFDAIRLLRKGKVVDGNLFFALVQEPDSTLGVANRYNFYGAHANWHGINGLRVGGVYFYQDDANTGLFRQTFGTISQVKLAGVKAHGEFYWQTGKTGGTRIEAFMASLGAGTDLNFGGHAFGVYGAGDLLSGDKSLGNGRYRSFNTLFATNHKFYGFMDAFTAFPAHTGGLGLVDIIGRAYYSHPVAGRKVKVSADYHKFRLHAQVPGVSMNLGHEVDATLKVGLGSGVNVQGGYSTFWPEGSTKSSGRTAREEWTYIMTSVSF